HHDKSVNYSQKHKPWGGLNLAVNFLWMNVFKKGGKYKVTISFSTTYYPLLSGRGKLGNFS
ncbi:MAG TPA: hypothetical protein PKD17_09310, partial [Cellvibrionaceae bacterium]|nr:hypothetical protein [Cellvibrionaceae bacterium]